MRRLWWRLFYREAYEACEGSAAVQLACPYCRELQTNSVVPCWPDELHVCHNTYSGRACGRKFIGPGPERLNMEQKEYYLRLPIGLLITTIQKILLTISSFLLWIVEQLQKFDDWMMK